MRAREIHPSRADVASAEVFFRALTSYYDFSTATALDAFARTGELTLAHYKDHVGEFDAWELNPIHTSYLTALRPRELRIGCSYRALDMTPYTYDLIVVDTPQGIHTDCSNNLKVEHFDFLKAMKPIMQSRCIVVFYVNLSPYNKEEVGSQGYDEYDEYNFERWMLARGRFYGVTDTQNLTLAQAITAYDRWFYVMGYKVVNLLSVPCYSDLINKDPYSCRVAFEIVAV